MLYTFSGDEEGGDGDEEGGGGKKKVRIRIRKFDWFIFCLRTNLRHFH